MLFAIRVPYGIFHIFINFKSRSINKMIRAEKAFKPSLGYFMCTNPRCRQSGNGDHMAGFTGSAKMKRGTKDLHYHSSFFTVSRKSSRLPFFEREEPMERGNIS